MGYDFIPSAGAQPIHRDVTYELEQFPEDKTEKDLERHVAPAIRGHMKDLLAAIASRGRPVADIEEGYISTASLHPGQPVACNWAGRSPGTPRPARSSATTRPTAC